VAAQLRREPDAQVELVDGSKGELSVSVDGREVFRKQGEHPPEADQIVKTVREKLPASSGAR
jgi:hypothetical protein